MGNLLAVRKRTDPKRSEISSRAAQYVRMSTDYQRYSIQNQAAAIAAFAQRSDDRPNLRRRRTPRTED